MFILKSKDVDILSFTKEFKEGEYVAEVKELLNLELLPPLLKLVPGKEQNYFNIWIKNRSISINRYYIKEILRSLGFDRYDPIDLVLYARGLSLNDTYWIYDTESSNVTWKEINIYENSFKDSLEYVTFFGHSKSLGGRLQNSAELTLAGMLPKCWRREGGLTCLYKRGTSEYANAGREPIIEVIAYRIGELLNISIAKQELLNYEGYLCTRSENFTSVNRSFIPAYEYLKDLEPTSWTYEMVCSRLGVIDAIDDMVVFDYVINNTDRHFSNFGVLIDPDTNTIIEFAPLFDHGYSLLHNTMDVDYPINQEEWYSRIIGPSSREKAKNVFKLRHRKGVHNLLANLETLFTEDVMMLANKDKVLISESMVKEVVSMIKWRCLDLLNG
ncbi:hypothetical protein F8154_12210 [Alkaliphilus pronyensis]|uniref:HipA-like C-terminal domain-containing protein n=1 Tax=Alkaliphilus pronyensis TaxID=1482732 RepID=A0A6I0F6Y8_9FIRM|nr:hypothetical protein [Alkaliphilus pronyensis]KAB3532132.1 hypothetical protein F8154_12210 [Alkaliphilus pronyensis]